MKDDSRREPTLADLEAFERLLRESLKTEPAQAGNAAGTGGQPAISATSAMAEFNRLVETPVAFDAAGKKPAGPATYSAIERALQSDLSDPPSATILPGPRDPLLDFEEELRRFEAMSRPADAPAATEPLPDLRRYADGDATGPSDHSPHEQSWHTPAEPQWNEQPAQSHPLDAAEQRLAEEAQAAALAGGAAMAGGAAGMAIARKSRSRGVFYALGGVAVAGLAVVGAMAMFSSKGGPSSGDKVPVIAAKPEPTKERPANPGGLEVPDQNKQVLAPRQLGTEQKPAEVVTQTEQPVDLNQVTRRDGVRVVAPSPFQNPPAASNAAEAPPAAEPRRVQSVRLSDPAVPQASPTPSLPSAGAVAGAAAGAAAIAAIAAGSGASTPRATTPAATPSQGLPPGAQAAIRPNPVTQVPAITPATPPAPSVAPAPAPAAPKVETRPQSPVTAPRPAPSTPAPAPTARAQNAPLQLTNRPPAATPQAQPAAPRVATAPTPATSGPGPGTGGGFAIQLASRPSEGDARSASQQLGSRFSSQLGGRAPSVVRGEANGQTVYRVRVSGFSQADANAACTRVRASGGACFVTRQ
jgi:hypothetical protein